MEGALLSCPLGAEVVGGRHRRGREESWAGGTLEATSRDAGAVTGAEGKKRVGQAGRWRPPAVMPEP